MSEESREKMRIVREVRGVTTFSHRVPRLSLRYRALCRARRTSSGRVTARSGGITSAADPVANQLAIQSALERNGVSEMIVEWKTSNVKC